MAWIRAMGGQTPETLLSPLSDLAESFTRWIQNSFIKGVGGTGNFNSNYGNISILNDIATITQAGGYGVGFVTKCEALKSYSLTYSFSSSTHQAGDSVRIQFYNGSSMISYTDFTGEGSNLTRAFSVPSGCTDVVIAPRQGDNGNMTFSYTGLIEL